MARISATQILAGLALAAAALMTAASASAARMSIPARARELVVVSSPTADPPGAQRIAMLRAYSRGSRASRWRLRLGPWATETGTAGLVAAAERREGDGATPVGVFGFGHTIYGTRPDPGGLHYRYHHLVCGDWWDEDPYSSLYNRFTHLPCGVDPAYARDSEALWSETLAYPYFAVINFNTGPIRRGRGAIGSGIFLHSWIDAPTAGCVALPLAHLLAVLRWLRPAQHPVIEIGIAGELAAIRVRRPRVS